MTSRRVYIIGAGFIARAHASATAKLPGASAEIFAADPSPEARAAFAKSFPDASMFPDAAAMLADKSRDDDVVIVSAPPFAHRDLALLAFGSGRHVLCEKPLALDRGQAMDMLAAARRAGRLFGCCSSRFVGTPAIMEARRLIETGALGRPYRVAWTQRRRRARAGIDDAPAAWFSDRSKSGGGVLADMAPYDLAALAALLDPVRVDILSAWTGNADGCKGAPGPVYDVEQHGLAAMRYHLADGTAVNLTYERAGYTHGEERMFVQVEGTAGAVGWGWPEKERAEDLTVTPGVGNIMQTLRSEITKPVEDREDRPLYFFNERIEGRPSPASVNGQAVFNFCCLRAIYDCAETGRPQRCAREEFGE
jgi:predicted dehydrogenase